MSFILDSTGMRITSNTNKLVFDSSRQSPHLIDSITGTFTSGGNLPGWVTTLQQYDYIPTEMGVECIAQQWIEYQDPFFSPSKTFILPYYKVSLPISNTREGAYPVGETNGNWIASNGGLLLRAYTSVRSFPNAGSLQGTQFIHAYCPSNGIFRVEVTTNIFGHMGRSDAVFIDPGYAGGTVQLTIPNTSYTVEYKIFLGTI